MTAQTTQPAVPADADEQGGAGRLRTIASAVALRQETSILLVILVIGIATGVKNPTFLQSSNLAEILRDAVITFVMGAGSAILIIGGGLDFSVGAVFTFSALVTCKLLVNDVPVAVALVAGLLVGAGLGAVNHLVITYVHVPPIIATLGTYFIVLGLNVAVTGGDDIVPLPQGFLNLGQNFFAGVSAVIWYGLIVGVVCWFLMEWTRFGVNVRALGGNRQAAIGNGLHVLRLDLALYAIAAGTAGLAGLIYAARVGAGQVSAGGAGLTLNVVAAVLIGGVSLFGGLGSITGVAVGAVLLSEIDNALVLAQVPPQYNNLVVGAIQIAAVGLDHVRRQRLYRKR